ncbi:hypothetical protein DVH24_021171 [Malus domestica]|uniref:Uncharacterized protein n=1 Tax=Malus domestica TaxID=3750 RepID=A0A498J8Y2_MALDO|nr:hypothetical protein DVH24_021171 [Malus domestica]
MVDPAVGGGFGEGDVGGRPSLPFPSLSAMAKLTRARCSLSGSASSSSSRSRSRSRFFSGSDSHSSSPFRSRFFTSSSSPSRSESSTARVEHMKWRILEPNSLNPFQKQIQPPPSSNPPAVLHLALKTLSESGHQHVYNVVERPLLLANLLSF